MEKSTPERDSVLPQMMVGITPYYWTSTNINAADNRYSTSICARTLEQLYINFLISCNQPFSLIHAASFRSLIQYINPEADHILPESPSTAKALIIDQFNLEKGAM